MKGDTSTHAEGIDPKGVSSERAWVKRHYAPLCSTLVAAKSGSICIVVVVKVSSGGTQERQIGARFTYIFVHMYIYIYICIYVREARATDRGVMIEHVEIGACKLKGNDNERGTQER